MQSIGEAVLLILHLIFRVIYFTRLGIQSICGRRQVFLFSLYLAQSIKSITSSFTLLIPKSNLLKTKLRLKVTQFPLITDLVQTTNLSYRIKEVTTTK